MNVTVNVADLTEEETSALQFAMQRFNMVRGANITDPNEFLAQFIRLRIVPQFTSDLKLTAKRAMQQVIRNRLTISSPAQLAAAQEAVENILPAPIADEELSADFQIE